MTRTQTLAVTPPGWCFGTVGRYWRKQFNDPLDAYRPELHDMRGPGPKWRKKHCAVQ